MQARGMGKVRQLKSGRLGRRKEGWGCGEGAASCVAGGAAAGGWAKGMGSGLRSGLQKKASVEGVASCITCSNPNPRVWVVALAK